MPLDDVHAVCFDVFGTVVDWRGSIAKEGLLLEDEWEMVVEKPFSVEALFATIKPLFE